MKIAQICRDDISVRFPELEKSAGETASHKNEAFFETAMEVKTPEEQCCILRQLQKLYPDESLRLYRLNKLPTTHESFVYALIRKDKKLLFVKQFLEQTIFDWEKKAWDLFKEDLKLKKISGIPKFIAELEPISNNENTLSSWSMCKPRWVGGP